MCGRYRLSRPDMIAAVREAMPTFEEFSEIKLVARYNVAPSQDAPVIRTNAAGHPELGLVKWGLVPHWTEGQAEEEAVQRP